MELKQNAPVLLQTCQLWAVLSALSTSQQGTAGGERLRSLAKWEAELPELPVIAGLGFSLVDLQGRVRMPQAKCWRHYRYYRNLQNTNATTILD